MNDHAPRSLDLLRLHGTFYALCARQAARLARRNVRRYLSASWQGLLRR